MPIKNDCPTHGCSCDTFSGKKNCVHGEGTSLPHKRRRSMVPARTAPAPTSNVVLGSAQQTHPNCKEHKGANTSHENWNCEKNRPNTLVPFSIPCTLCRLRCQSARVLGLLSIPWRQEPNTPIPCTFGATAQCTTFVIGVSHADRHSHTRAFFYVCVPPICGTCVVRNKTRPCKVLALEHRENALSFRVYLAHACFRRIMNMAKIKFYLHQRVSHDVAQHILEYCFYDIVQAGYEVIGAHYTNNKQPRATAKIPRVATSGALYRRHYTSFPHPGQKEHYMNFIISHARRDVQVCNLQVMSK